MKLAEAIQKARHVYIIGNGGSYANAIHWCNDLLSVGIKAFTLDPSTLTAYANDFGYECSFSRWIETVADYGDLVIGLTGSGNSTNIIEALRLAHIAHASTWAVTGTFSRNNEAAQYAEDCTTEGADMQAAEEYQLVLAHQCMKWLKEHK